MMLGIFLIPLCLLLPGVGGSEFPDFGEDYDGYDDHYICEGDGCAWRTMYLYFHKTVEVPNKTVTFEEYEYFDVDTAGLLADCAPSLSVGDMATKMKSCEEVNRKYRDACKYRKKGWLDKDGKSVNKTLGTDFKEIEGASDNIMKCLEWDGVDDYDYDYYDYYYDYDFLEESDDIQVRAKRELKSSMPEFMVQKLRLKRSAYNKNKNPKKENTHVKKRRNRKGKNKGKHGRRGKKAGKKGKKQGQRKKKSALKGKRGGKLRRQSGKKFGNGGQDSKERKHKAAKKSWKKKSQHRKKKGNNKANENKKKNEEKKKKKKERKLLKALGYDAKPSEEILNKLDCVERAIEYGLEKCGEKIFENVERP